jgi:hypothetical protein
VPPTTTGVTTTDIGLTVARAKIENLIHPNANCMDSFLRGNYGDFMGGTIIPDFSLISLGSNFWGYMKASALTLSIKGSLVGLPKALGSLARTTASNLANYPGMAAAAADNVEASLWYANTSAAVDVVVAPVGAFATSFSTTADVVGRFSCW